MNPYVIFADSSCDLPQATLDEWNIRYGSLYFRFDDSDREYHNYDMSAKDFYAKMRAGHNCTTSAVNEGDFLAAFEPILEAGQDILYIGFSSGLSATYQCGAAAAAEILLRYPERKIVTVDSLAASAGYGMLLYLAKCRRDEGAGIEELAAYIEEIKLNLCHWFTVDDLEHLIKGGRVIKVLASLGGALQLKPVLHVDNAGHLIPVSVARGRKKSLRALADQYGKRAIEKGKPPVFIFHADCLEDVEYLVADLKERFDVETDRIVDVGPVIGAHTGPGVVSLFFLGRER